MWTEEKVYEKIKSMKIENIIYQKQFQFVINEKPEQYVRERSGRGKHFYNPKGNIIDKYKKIMMSQLGKENKKYMEKIFDDSDAGDLDYTVDIECSFYIPVPKNDSILTAAKKEMKLILPNKRPDLDNYGKLLLDALHDVVYRDDCKVCDLHSKKFYSIHPRTEITATINITKVKED